MALPGKIVDISSNNAGPIDWVRARDEGGVIAAFPKATEGTGYTNPCFAGPDRHDRDDALAAGLHVAAYHYQGSGTPTAEAAFFRSVAGGLGKILDRETSTDDAWTNAFLTDLNQPSDEEMTYGSAGYLAGSKIVRGLLFPAAYGSSPPFGSCWQYTDAAVIPGFPGPVDCSEWTGSQGQFSSFFGLPAGGGQHLGVTDVCGMAVTPTGKGYWLVASDGGVFCEGDAGFHDSMGGKPLSAPVVGMAASPSGQGYWLVARDGGVFGFGDAPFDGSEGGKQVAAPVVGMASNHRGGYWLVAADGGVFSFDAAFHGSAADEHLSAPVVGMASTPSGNGYWLVGADGGIFNYGDAAFHGSMGGKPLASPVVGMTVVAGGGYLLTASDGGIFNFGAAFHGSMGGVKLTRPVVGVASADADGYWLVGQDGGIFAFGDAPFEGAIA